MRIQILLLLCLCSTLLHAQRNGIIRAEVVDSLSSAPVADATISLLSAKDSSLVSFAMTDAQGRFRFTDLKDGVYRLLISHVNYHGFSMTVTLDAQHRNATPGRLVLSDKSLLGEVIVSTNAPPVTLIGDTVQYHADAFRTPPNASVEQLLKKMPGIQVDKDGNVKAQGQTVKRVLVDGKEFFGNDPKMATKNLPADAIDKVQVYSKQSDQAALTGFDDGNSETTINLKLKKDKKHGSFGKLNGGLGRDVGGTRYQGNFNLNSFKGARQLSVIGMANNTNTEAFSFMDLLNFTGDISRLPKGGTGNTEQLAGMSAGTPGNQGVRTIWGGGLNYNDVIGTRTAFTSNYFYNQYNPRTVSDVQRRYLLPDSTYSYTSHSLTNTSNATHRLNLGIDYRVDSFNSIKVSPSFAWQDSRNHSISDYTQAGSDGRLSNKGYSDNLFNNSGYHFRNDLLFRKRFRRKGRSFSMNLQTTLNSSTGVGFQRSVNEFYGASGMPDRRDSINQRMHSDGEQLGYNARAVYTEPVFRRSLLEFSLSRSWTRTRADRQTWDYNAGEGKYSNLNDSLSNDFENSYGYITGGVRLRTQKKRLVYSFGLNWQRALLEGRVITGLKDSLMNKSFNNLRPTARVQYNFTRYKNLIVNYSSQTRQPDITQLQPVADISDPLNIRGGNPDLHQEFVQSVQLNYTGINPFRNKSLFAGFTFNTTNNKIVNADSVFSNGVKKTRPVNVDGVYNLSGDISAGLPLGFMKGTLRAGSGFGYNCGKQFVNGSPNTIGTVSAGPRLSLDFSPDDRIDYSIGATLAYNHTSYSLQPAFNTNYLSQLYEAGFNWNGTRGFNFSTDFAYTLNRQLADGFNTSVPLWNVSVSKLLLKSKRGELKLRVNDLLNRNVGVNRSSNQNYIQDSRINSLQRYGILSFTYNLSRTGMGDRQVIRIN